MERQSRSSMPDDGQIAELRAKADAGDRDAAGRLGEELARRGDHEGALRVLADAYGNCSRTTQELAELLTEQDNPEGAVDVWLVSDAVWQNPAGRRAEHLSMLSPEDYLEATTDDPAEWAFLEAEKLASLKADWGDGRNRYVARWAEHEAPGSQGRSCTWSPRPLDRAKAMLMSDLGRIHDQWAAQGCRSPERYQQALDTLERARGPVTIDLPGHVLTISEARRREP